MKIVLDSFTMRKSDSAQIESGISGLKLMKNASNFIYKNIDKNLETAIICGTGNNGGDGLSLAETMLENGNKIKVYLVNSPKTESSLYYYEKIKKLGAQIFDIDNIEKIKEPQIVDCLFGIGLNKEPMGKYKKTIDLINNSNAFVVSADIPSGLNADNGIAYSSCVKANLTTTFGAIKPGLYLCDAKDYTGIVLADDIGIKPQEPKYYIYEKNDLKKYFMTLKQNLHKYNNGKATIIGGSSNFVGAIILSNLAETALRTGCGLCNIAVPKFLADSVRDRILDSTLSILKCDENFSLYEKENFENAILKSKAVAIGMGMGANNNINMMLENLLEKDISLLIDADGINQLSNNVELLENKNANVIITPHLKEFSRLVKLSVNQIKQDPINIAKDFAKKYNITVLLKGTTTIITDGKNVALSPYGCSAMAKGGSGDVLSGVIVGLLARGIDCFDAGVLGAYIHGKSGELASENIGEYGMIASDIPKYIPKVIKAILATNIL